MQLQTVKKFVSATLVSSAITAVAEAGPLYATREADSNEVALVESVNGHIVIFPEGKTKPTLLEPLDVLSDGTRLDLQDRSELRICHYPTRQLLTLQGPLRASISRDGLAVANGRPPTVAVEACGVPRSAAVSGGLLLRGATHSLSDLSRQPQPAEPGCPRTGTSAGAEGKHRPDTAETVPQLASAASVTVPSGTTTPPGAGSPTTAAGSHSRGVTKGRYERGKAAQVERWQELSQTREAQLQHTKNASAGSRNRGRERIEGFLGIAQKMRGSVLARYR